VVAEDLDELEVGLGRLDGDDVGVETLDRGEDVGKVGVAEAGESGGRWSEDRPAFQTTFKGTPEKLTESGSG
jgi:hypothetical protein